MVKRNPAVVGRAEDLLEEVIYESLTEENEDLFLRREKA
jgi:hypothetical protein